MFWLGSFFCGKEYMGAIDNLGGWYDLAVNQFGSGQAREALGQTVANVGSMVTPGVTGSGSVTGLANTIAGKPVIGTYDSPFIQPKPASMVTGNGQTNSTNTNVNTSTNVNTTPSAPRDTELDQLAKMDRNPPQEQRYQELLRQQRESQGASDADLNAIYQPQIDYLGKAESNLNTDYQSALSQIGDNYNVNSQLLGDQKTSAIGQMDLQGTQAGQRKEDALSSARRLYDELRRGYQQRFGGSTSAGQAATELSSVEQQRQQGLTVRDYNSLMNEVGYRKADIEKEYSNKVLQIKTQKDSALLQAQSDFNSKILEIARNRSEVESAKAQAKLSALMDLRNKSFAIQQQTLAFEQNLALQKQAASDALQAWGTKVAGSLQYTTNAYNQTLGGSSMSTNPTSSLTASAPGAITPNTYAGQISQSKNKDWYSIFS